MKLRDNSAKNTINTVLNFAGFIIKWFDADGLVDFTETYVCVHHSELLGKFTFTTYIRTAADFYSLL